MSDKENLDRLVKVRGYTRQRLTKLCTEVEAQVQNITSQQQENYIERLLTFQKELEKSNREILPLYVALDWTEEAIDTKVSEIDEYEQKVLNAISLVKNVNPIELGSNSIEQPGVRHFCGEPKNFELPKIPLPTFSNGKDEIFRKFISGFEAVINKHRLTSYEKFIYLRRQLDKGPKVLVDSLDVDQQLYETAKDLLSEAFDDETAVKYDVIRRIAALKFGIEDDPHCYIGNMRTLVGDAKNLNLTADDFIQFFV